MLNVLVSKFFETVPNAWYTSFWFLGVFWWSWMHTTSYLGSCCGFFRNPRKVAFQPCRVIGPISSPFLGSRRSCWYLPRIQILAQLEAETTKKLIMRFQFLPYLTYLQLFIYDDIPVKMLEPSVPLDIIGSILRMQRKTTHYNYYKPSFLFVAITFIFPKRFVRSCTSSFLTRSFAMGSMCRDHSIFPLRIFS